jgi:hypothetical protein
MPIEKVIDQRRLPAAMRSCDRNSHVAARAKYLPAECRARRQKARPLASGRCWKGVRRTAHNCVLRRASSWGCQGSVRRGICARLAPRTLSAGTGAQAIDGNKRSPFKAATAKSITDGPKTGLRGLVLPHCDSIRRIGRRLDLRPWCKRSLSTSLGLGRRVGSRAEVG